MEKVVPRRAEYGSGLCAAWYDGSFLFVFTTLSSGADGHVSGTVDSDIFGEPVTETGVFAASSTIVFAYAGKSYDTVTGLSDYGFRDYAPAQARFTTVDPIRDGSNWYAYCNSNPVNYVDAWGLKANESRTVQVTIKNRDPTPNANEIINSSGDVGHTWLHIKNGSTPETDDDEYGWGYDGDDLEVANGLSQPGIKLGNGANGTYYTSSYTFSVTQTEANKIVEYFDNQKNMEYNLGGREATKDKATMCTETVVNAVDYSGGMSDKEKAIIKAPYAKWSASFPTSIPSDYLGAAVATKDLTSPNPNEMEERIKILNQMKGTP